MPSATCTLDSMIRVLATIAAQVLLIFSAESIAALLEQPDNIAVQKQASIVSIKVIYSKDTDDCAAPDSQCNEINGSGFVFHESGYIFTNKHIAPPSTGYKYYKISGRIGSKILGDEVPLRLVTPVNNLDLSILKSEIPQKYSAVAFGDSSNLSEGDPIFAWGFPKNKDLLYAHGHVSGYDITESLLLTHLEPFGLENSGSPVFDESGLLVGIMSRGTLSIQEAHINYVIPSNFFSHIVHKIAKFESDKRPPVSKVRVEVVKGRADTKQRSERIDVMQNTQMSVTPTTKAYSFPFMADPGYLIQNAHFGETSVRGMSDYRLTIGEDKKSVMVQFNLTSGPFYDQYRGWLDGTLTIEQVKAQSPVAKTEIHLTQGSHFLTKDQLPPLGNISDAWTIDLIDEDGLSLAQILSNGDDKVVESNLGNFRVELDRKPNGTYLNIMGVTQ